MDQATNLLKPEVVGHYRTNNEAERLYRKSGPLERERIREIIGRHLPPPPATVLDVGGAAGVHAFWLTNASYTVHLIDALPLHIEQARAGASEFPGLTIASAEVGDARALHHPDNSADAVLLLGPLYHLIDHADRLLALGEAVRVVRPGGLVFAVAVSRFASLMDGLSSGYLDDPDFQQIVRQDLIDGQHRDPTERGYFTTTFFHHPDELRAEVTESGLDLVELVGLNGLAFTLPNFAAWWDDPARRERLLEMSRAIESEPSLMGLHAHILAVGRKGDASN